MSFSNNKNKSPTSQIYEPWEILAEAGGEIPPFTHPHMSNPWLPPSQT